ncbi:MAG TPA: GNAT family N-acetyltransferase [Anaerolineales bacterium]|nr:GNAT family N-acetyltransferase [Anaerolineales bacterium]
MTWIWLSVVSPGRIILSKQHVWFCHHEPDRQGQFVQLAIWPRLLIRISPAVGEEEQTSLMVTYTDSLIDITSDYLKGGFFIGWPNPPSPDTHYQILANSAAIVLARIEDGTVVGFITAVSDGISCAYIPHLEVLPAYQGQGIGTSLLRQMLERLKHLYMIDLVCDPELQPFYERLGMRAVVGMVVRNYDRQSGEANARPEK